MKKLIAAAVASSMTAFAMADLSITGDAKYEYDHKEDANGVKQNTANTEMHINFAGKTGDTSVVAKFELDTSGDNGAGIDLEDMYMTTKVGDVSVKAGNYASSTTALIGEIDQGGRAQNKVTLGYKVGGLDFYVGNSDLEASEAANTVTVTSAASGSAATVTHAADDADGDTKLNNNMFAGVKFAVAGQNIELKKNSNTQDSFGIKGSVSGVTYRYEATDIDGEGDASYIELNTKVGGVSLQYAALDADVAASLDEDDSGIFAQEAGATANGDAQRQIALSTAVDGTTVKLMSGTIDKGLSSTKDMDYYTITASRPLSSGSTLVVTYNDKDELKTGGTVGSNENLEVELNVKF